MTMVISCRMTIRLMRRELVPNLWWGWRNQSGSTPSSATRLSTPLEPMMAVFTAPDRIKVPTSTTKAWNSSHRHRPHQEHGESADQVVQELLPRAVRNDHHREEGDQRREQHAVDED